MYKIYIVILKLAKMLKNVCFGLFRFSILAIASKMQKGENPFFFKPSMLKIHMKHHDKMIRTTVICLRLWI
jgi:hypothetical protein